MPSSVPSSTETGAQKAIHQQRQAQPITPSQINQTFTLAPRWMGGNCQAQLCPPGKLPWEKSDPREGWKAMRNIFMEQTEGKDWHGEVCLSKPDDSSEIRSMTLLIPLLSRFLVFAPCWVWLTVLPPVNTLVWCSALLGHFAASAARCTKEKSNHADGRF